QKTAGADWRHQYPRWQGHLRSCGGSARLEIQGTVLTAQLPAKVAVRQDRKVGGVRFSSVQNGQPIQKLMKKLICILASPALLAPWGEKTEKTAVAPGSSTGLWQKAATKSTVVTRASTAAVN